MRVFLRGTEGVCSESAPGQYSQPRDFVIRPKDSITVKYNVVPLRIGEFPLEIFVVSPRGNDAVRRMLKVLVGLIFFLCVHDKFIVYIYQRFMKLEQVCLFPKVNYTLLYLEIYLSNMIVWVEFYTQIWKSIYQIWQIKLNSMPKSGR